MKNQTMSMNEWLFLILLSVLWGGSFFFVGVIVQELPPFTLVLSRVSIAAIGLTLYIYLSGRRMPSSPRLWGAFLVMGALNGLIPYSLIAWGQGHISSGLAAILNGTTPLFSVVLAHFLTREERMTPNRVAGVILGLVGVVVLIGPESLHGLSIHGLGQVAILGAALSYACAGIYGRRFRGIPPTIAATGQLTGATVLVLPLALVIEKPWTLSPSTTTVSALLGLAIVSTAIAYLIFFRILAVAGATNVMLVTLLIPASALLLGVLILGERPSRTLFAGLALIITGLVSIDGRLFVHVRSILGVFSPWDPAVVSPSKLDSGAESP